MADFSRDEIKTLASQQTGPFVSLYMPIRRETVTPKQDTIRLKHLIQNAREQLLALHTDKDTVEAILAPTVELLTDVPFWQQHREGLALFLAPDFFRWYDDASIAVEFDEAVHVGSQFSFKPLLPLLTGDGPFYILALKQEHFGLLHATRDTVRPIDLLGSPTNIEEALGEEIPGKERRVHPLNMADGTQEGVVDAHDPSKEEKDRVLRYCRIVDKQIHKYLAGKNAPLVLAALEYLHPIYHEANTYPHLLDEGIRRNVEHMPAEELKNEAWKIVEPSFRKERNDAITRYHSFSNTTQVSNKLSGILTAAHFGRVATLFLERGKQQFGTFDPNTQKLEVFKEEHPGSVDLFDQAATQTVLNGGTVYVLPPEEMPDKQSGIAAIFRYP